MYLVLVFNSTAGDQFPSKWFVCAKLRVFQENLICTLNYSLMCRLNSNSKIKNTSSQSKSGYSVSILYQNHLNNTIINDNNNSIFYEIRQQFAFTL